MNTTSTEALRERLALVKGHWREISKLSGVPYDTLTKVAQGKTKNTGVETFTAIDFGLRAFAERVDGSRPASAEAAVLAPGQ